MSVNWWTLADVYHAENESIRDVGGPCNHRESPPECIRAAQRHATAYNAALAASPSESGLLPEKGFAADRPTGPRTLQGHALARNLRDRDPEVDWDAWVRKIEEQAVSPRELHALIEASAAEKETPFLDETDEREWPLGGPAAAEKEPDADPLADEHRR